MEYSDHLLKYATDIAYYDLDKIIEAMDPILYPAPTIKEIINYAKGMDDEWGNDIVRKLETHIK